MAATGHGVFTGLCCTALGLPPNAAEQQSTLSLTGGRLPPAALSSGSPILGIFAHHDQQHCKQSEAGQAARLWDRHTEGGSGRLAPTAAALQQTTSQRPKHPCTGTISSCPPARLDTTTAPPTLIPMM